MANAIIEVIKTVTVTLTMSEDEAIWLRGAIRNPIYHGILDPEDKVEDGKVKDIREGIYWALDEELENG